MKELLNKLHKVKQGKQGSGGRHTQAAQEVVLRQVVQEESEDLNQVMFIFL